jgi:phytoene synthase
VSLSASAVRACDESIRVNSRSFSLAARFLPPHTRAKAVVLYAWCRRADDLVDQASSAHAGLALGRLHAELDRIYVDGKMGDLALDAFREVVHRCRIPRSYPDELLAGLAMDVRGTHYRNMAELVHYSYRVAGTVGLMMCHVMGVRDEEAVRHATHLGIAMQFTNIARDVLEDWQRGRIYLPDDLLLAHGLGELVERRDLDLLRCDRRRLSQAVLALLDEADRYYRSGDRGMRALSAPCALAIRTARHVYADIGALLRERGGDSLRGRVVAGTARKLQRTGHALAETAFELPGRMRDGLRASAPPTRIPLRVISFPHDVLPL